MVRIAKKERCSQRRPGRRVRRPTIRVGPNKVFVKHLSCMSVAIDHCQSKFYRNTDANPETRARQELRRAKPQKAAIGAISSVLLNLLIPRKKFAGKAREGDRPVAGRCFAIGRVFEMKMLDSVADIDRVCVLERLPFLALAE